MCDCFHLAFPNWHAASSGTGAGRRLTGPEPGTEDDSICDEPSQFTEGERPRPQGSSPVEEFPETYIDSDKEVQNTNTPPSNTTKQCEAEHDQHHKSGSGKKAKKSGLGSMFEKRSTPKMSKLKEVHSPESGVIVKTAKDGCAEGLVYGGGGKDGIFIKEVIPESPASKSLKLKEGDQILSATVYFDNVSYEDAIQILEHAQAYKLKLCLKRKPDITESEPAIESEEGEVPALEMREKGKTKRRGDGRVSWPKFPSFGKGQKSRFTRSHSSSEADEQRKLELSPTTSDTESPIKSQDALKGKKRHKIKLSSLTKRGRISSSEDQDMDTPTTGQISGKILETHEASDVLSPECLESPSGETPEVCVTEDVKVVEDKRFEKKLTEPQTVQHKVELITVDSSLKTADLTVALPDKESNSGIKSPDGKKKKKERSELKMKILGKDKSHKKDTKAKSPKRLKTLGASIEIPDQPENVKSDAILSPESHAKQQENQLALDANTQIISSESSRGISAKSVTTQMEMGVLKEELDISDVALIRKSPQKSEEKMRKGKGMKQKQETKTGPIFKLPKIGFSDISTEETVQKINVNVEECTTKIEHLTSEGTEVKEDPYEQLSKRSLSRTQLPKREEIEIPGMEDMSMKTTVKGFKEPKAGFMGQYEELQAETVQLSIDVDSVKEAVSKLPGYKLPRVDVSGVPIPEEITVIDANAQRISVKTPTKVVDSKTKHETHFAKFDITASPEISKTTVKLPRITPADSTLEEPLFETRVDLNKIEKKYKTKAKQSDKEIYKREDIVIPGKESGQEVAIRQKQDTEGIKSEYESAVTLSPKESDKKSKKAKITAAGFGIAKPNIKIPDIGIDFKQNISQKKGDTVRGEGTTDSQEVKTLETESMKGKVQIGGVIADVKIPEIDSIEYIDSGVGSPAKKDGGISLTGFGVNLDAVMPDTNTSIPEIRGEVKDVDVEQHTIKLPKFGAATVDISVNVPDADKDINIVGAETNTFEREGKASKFKMPNLDISMPKVKGPKIGASLSQKDVDITQAEAKAEVKLPKVPEVDVTLGNIDVSIPEQKMEVERPGLEIQPLTTEGELDGQGGKFKMPKFGISLPKVKGPQADLSVSKTDVDVTLPEAKAEVKPPHVEHADPGFKVEVKSPEIALPKVKGPKINVSFSKKAVDVPLPEADAEVSLGKAGVSLPEEKLEFEKPELEMKPLRSEVEIDGQGGKFKMPKLGMSMPKVKGHEIHFGLSKKDGGVTPQEAKAEAKVPEVELKQPAANVEFKAPEIKVAAEGSSSKFKMPTFKRPKFGVGTPDISVKVSDMHKDVKIDGTDITIPEEETVVNIAAPNIAIEGPPMDMKTIETEHDGKGSKFKMPHLGFSMPKLKGPKIDLNLSKKDRDVTLPEAGAIKLSETDFGQVDAEAEIEVPGGKAEVKLPEAPRIAVEMKPPEHEAEMDVHGGKFKIPKFGIKMPKVKGPEFDLSSSKKNVDVTLPQTNVEVKLPDAPKMDVSLGEAEVLIPEAKVDFKKPDVELEGQGGKFKMPKFGITMPKVKGPEIDFSLSKKDVDVTLPEAKAKVELPKAPEIAVDMKPPEHEAEMDVQGGKFKIPKFGIKMPKVKGPEFDLSSSKKNVDVTLPQTNVEVKLPDALKMDVSLGEAEVLIPEAKVDFKKPDFEIKPSQIDVELEGQGGKLKTPKFAITMPKVKGPEIDLSLSEKDVDVTLPEAKAEIELPKAPKIAVDMKLPECQEESDGQGSKFKMPKFGISMPKVKGPEIDFSLSKKDVDVTLPEAKADVDLPGADKREPSVKAEIKAAEIDAPLSNVKGSSSSKFKMPTLKFPNFGVATPNISTEVHDVDKKIKIDGADMHISVPHTDADVPEVKAEIHLPEVEVKEPSGGVVIAQQPSFEVDAKMKKSRFSLPRFSFTKQSVKAPEADVSHLDLDVTIPEGKVKMKGGEADMKPPECEGEIVGQGSKFKMPKFGITMPKVAGPETDLSLSKRDVDVTLPEAKAEVKLPDMKLKEPSAEVEIKAPEIKVVTKDTEGSPSKFKMPTFKLPKFGVGMPSASVEVPDTDKNFKIEGADIKIPEEVLTVDIAAPSIDTEGPSIHMKSTGTEHEQKGSKFKMPKFGITMPKVTGPDIDLSLSKKDVDVTLPEAKAEVKLPDMELREPSAEVEIKAPEIKVVTKDTEGSPSKFKMPTFKLPKFGVGTASGTVEVPDMDKDIKIDGADIKIPEEVLTVDVAAPSIGTEGPSIHMKTTGTEHEQKGSKFKMPKFGITMPTVTGPEIDLSLSKKDVDVTLPEAKAEVQLPDVKIRQSSAEVEIKSPEIEAQVGDVVGSPSKFKMPTFKLPKFGVGMPSASVEVPDTDKNIKIDGADIKIPEEVLTVDVAAPSIDTEGPSIHMKSTGTEHEQKGSKFKMPKFGITMPKVTGPDIDLSLSKKDVDVTLPEGKAEVKLPDMELKEPSAEVEIKAPAIKVVTKEAERSPSKFKMPTFKLPKFGVGMPSASVEVPDTDKNIKIDGADIKIPEEVLTVDIAAPSIDTKAPSIHMKSTGAEHEQKGSKFKMPKFGITMPKVTGPDIDLSLSKKDVDVTLPEAKAEVKLPDMKLREPSAEVEIKAPEIKVVTKETEGSPSKFKMPTFKLPKFGVGTASASIEVPDTDKNIKIAGGDIKIPEEVLTVDVAAPSIDTEGPSIHMKTIGTEHEQKGSKFKMPKFGITMPKVTGPEIDLSLSKKDVDVTLPEAKAEVQLPDVKIRQSSAEVEIKSPEIEAQVGDVVGSPSKFKMPTFKLPKFGVGMPSASVEVPDTDKNIKIDGADIKIPEEVLTVDVAAPSIDTEGPSIIMKSTGTEHEQKGSKFKMPKFGITMPKATGPDIDLSLSKKDVDVTLPEAKAEVKLPDMEMKEPSAEVEIKAPEIKVVTKNTEGSPSKFKMPTFKLPKFGVGMPSASVEVPDTDKNIKIEGADIKIPEEVLTVDVAAPSIDTEGPSIHMKSTGTEHEQKGSKFKMPKFGITMPKVTGPDIDLSLSKKDVDVTLPEGKAEVKLPDMELKEPSAEVEIKAPEIKVVTKDTEGSPSKFKMPTFKLPKFGIGKPSASVEVPDTDKNIKIEGADIKIPEEVLTVDVAAPSIDTEGPSIHMKSTGTEHEQKGSKFKMPKFGITMPKVTGPDIDLSLSKKDVDVTLPEGKAEVKLPDVELKEPSAEVEIKAPEIEAEVGNVVGSPSKLKMPAFTLPRFGVAIQKVSVEVPDMDKDINIDGAKLEVPKEGATVDVTAPSIETEGPYVDVKAKGSELEGSGSKFKMPKFGISMPKVRAELPHVDVSLPEGEVKVKQPEMDIKAPELEAERGQGSKFKLPKFGITVSKVKDSEEHLNASQKDVDITLPKVKAEVKLPEIEVKSSTCVEITDSETEAQSKDVGGSPLKFKMPTMKMPKFGGATYDVTIEAPDADKVAKTDGTKLKEDIAVNIKGPSVDIKTDVSKAGKRDTEMPKTETDSGGSSSPSKFKLPLFKMPKLSFSKSKPEDKTEAESNEDQLEIEVEPKGESKSPKMTLTSFGEIFKNIDVEFDVPKTEKEEETLGTSKDIHETHETCETQLQPKEKEKSAKQDTTKSPERTGWFKFPKFGLSSPSEPAKIREKVEHKDEKSPVRETVDEEISPTCSVQSSDAFADISSAMTSEHVGLSLSSPTKVTVKYSDPNTVTGLEEMHSNIITSTTRTELISVEPNLPEKITILSSGVSSSSEDTIRLESGKIHVFTSNIQATPEAQHAKLLTAVQVQSAEGLPLRSQASEASSCTVEDSQSGKRTILERLLVRQTSSERSGSKETIVVTKQITHMFDSSEPISGETASSIQRLRDSVHSEKMKFFDGDEK